MMNRSIQFIVCVLAILCQNINSAVAQTRSYDGVISCSTGTVGTAR